MRVLLNDTGVPAPTRLDLALEADRATLARLYRYSMTSGVRSNMVSTLDGAGHGADGRSGSINTPADVAVFALLRAHADAVILGAGTVRAEGYGPVRVDESWAGLRAGRPPHPALVVVSASGALPDGLHDGSIEPAGGPVLLATTPAAGAGRLEHARAVFGPEAVLVLDEASGSDSGAGSGAASGGGVDPRALVAELADRGLRRLLCEGGPSLLGRVAAAGVLDEWCLTVVPRLAGGDAPRVLTGAGELTSDLRPVLLLEADGALIGRWRTR